MITTRVRTSRLVNYYNLVEALEMLPFLNIFPPSGEWSIKIFVICSQPRSRGLSSSPPGARDSLAQGGGMKTDPGNEVDLFIVSPRFCYIMLIGDLQNNLK